MAFPSDLTRTKDWGTEILTDSDLEGQFDNIIDWVDDFADETTGHKHDGTTNEGPLINLNGGNIGVTGELQETDGGTGLSTYTLGDIIYASAADTLSALAKDANESRYLSNQGASNIPQWEKVDIATGIEIASEAQGDVLYYNGSAWTRLGAGTSGKFLRTTGAASNPEWGDAAYVFTSSATFSASQNVSITQTISAGDSYLFIYEGTLATASATLGFRVNSASTSSYSWLISGADVIGGSLASNDETSASATSIGIFGTNTVTDGAASHFLIRAYISARNSDTQISWEATHIQDTNDMDVAKGIGFYSAGTPTSIQMLDTSGGSGTFTGRYYVYKLGQA